MPTLSCPKDYYELGDNS